MKSMTKLLLISIVLYAMAVSGCTSKENTQPIESVKVVYVDRPVSTPEQEVTINDIGCDEQSYEIGKENSITYTGIVPNIAATQIADADKCVIEFQVYNPRADEIDRRVQNLYEFDSIKLSCVGNGKEKEYAPVKLGRTVRLCSGRSNTTIIASGDILEDLQIDDNEPFTCWAGFCKNGHEIFAVEMEIPSQSNQGKLPITQIVDPEKKDWTA